MAPPGRPVYDSTSVAWIESFLHVFLFIKRPWGLFAYPSWYFDAFTELRAVGEEEGGSGVMLHSGP